MLPKLPRATPNRNILPDVDDPNFYCKSCQLTYKNRTKFRKHIRKIHKMELAHITRQLIHDPTAAMADLEHPENTSCTICMIKYTDKYLYRRHMKRVHQMDLNNKVDPNIQPDPEDPNFYCKPCQRHYSTRKYFRHHIRLFHPSTKLEK